MLKSFGQPSPEKKSCSDEDEKIEEEIEEWEWNVSEVVQMIQKDIIVIQSDDSFIKPYYLLKCSTEPNQITESFTDDYGHIFHMGHIIVMGHYLEVHKKFKNATLLFEDVRKLVAVSSYFNAGIAPSSKCNRG